MNVFIRLIMVVAPAGFFTIAYAQSATISGQNPLEIYQQLKTLRFDPELVADVDNVVLQKEHATIRFESGEVYFAEPVGGAVSAMVFLGQGSFKLYPPTRTEQEQVRRFMDQDSVDEEFSALYVRFNDNTYESLKAQLDFKHKQPPKAVERQHKTITEMFLKDRHINLHAAFTTVILNESAGRFFFAVMEYGKQDKNMPQYLIFTKDDNASEGVALYQYSPHAYDKPFYTLCEYDPDYDAGEMRPDTSEIPAGVYPSHYKMDIEIDGEKIINRADITIKSHVERVSAVSFVLFDEMEIDSVHDARGDTLQYVQEEDEAGVTIFLQQPMPVGDLQLSVYYHGKALSNSGDIYILRNNVYWYPRRGYFIPATYDITYRYDKNKQLLSVGTLKEESQDKKHRIARWVEETAVPAFAFGIANFDSTALHSGDQPTISVHSASNRSKSTRKRIGGDVASSFYFFNNLLGVYPYDHLHVLETPSSTSNGFAGLLFLASFSYEYELAGINEALRGHEVSHQWWGNIVGWRTYHDQWLSEGLAEYSGALATQFLLKDDETFLGIISGWQTDLLSGGHIGVSIGLQRFGYSTADLSRSDGLKAGPIWLGNRLGQKHPVDYHLIVYEKGALVVHMLRLMLRDFQTGNDERFFALLRDFVAVYQNRKADTAGFAELVARHTGRDMGRFFEQWVFGTEVPTLSYDYKIKQDSTQQYWVEMEVEQENVTEPFELQIPVGVMFHEEEDIRLFEIDNWQSSGRLGPFVRQPARVIFNTFGGVLARIKRK